MNIFVGNLLFEANEDDLRKLFVGFGAVVSVSIVMEKKGKKSRGFGFVEMSGDQEAKQAIAALDGKEFMGRLLNVSPALPKSEAEQRREEKKQLKLKLKAETKQHLLAEKEQKKLFAKPFVKPFIGRPGTYRGGRRTRSFLMQRAAAGIEVPQNQPRKEQVNPMRWRKRQEQPPTSKPWRKADGGPKPPWQKSQGEVKPVSRPTSKPWRKPDADGPKPWRKSSEERPQRSRFNPSTSSRTTMSERPVVSGVESSKGRSRPKGRKKPGVIIRKTKN